ncbi:MAG: Glyoxalase superfamily enzyme 3-demethylubiquinone-9 3-methyltransferase [Mucilaginibacter sp.]|nr:Glyoxalase superfamily enzyme 3-demethylubiquinone-9 3-methyltransferase [Mucilaginibacter sp.]
MFNRNAEEAMNFYISLFPNSDNGTVLMPLGTYPFSKKYAWLSDKFNVSWQLSYTLTF